MVPKGSPLMSWLVTYAAEVMNKYKVRADGRTAYEKITGHKWKPQAIGFAEEVDFILETDKKNMHKGDSRVMKGIFLGHEWRTTECLVATKDGIFKCRTVRRRPEEISYDGDCTDYLKISYEEYVLKGARTAPLVNYPKIGTPEPEGPIPVRGREFVPRRMYMRTTD